MTEEEFRRQQPGGEDSHIPLPLDDERLTPNMLADQCAAILPDLLAQREAATTTRERKQLGSRIRAARTMLTWAKTRAGYVPVGRNTRARGSGGIVGPR